MRTIIPSLLLVISSTLAFTHFPSAFTKRSTFQGFGPKQLRAAAAENEDAEKKKVLDTVLSSIERNYGRGSIMRLGDNDA